MHVCTCALRVKRGCNNGGLGNLYEGMVYVMRVDVAVVEERISQLRLLEDML